MLDVIQIESLRAWIGRTETSFDTVSAEPINGLAALLNYPDMPWTVEAPPLAHWLFFHPRTRQSELDDDGHPKRGDFLPPVPLPRRMWAGGRLVFMHPLRLGASLERRFGIADVGQKRGASGDLIFVTVRYEVFANGNLALVEQQDPVYRSADKGAPPLEARSPDVGSGEGPSTSLIRTIMPDPTLLFRTSALTFNRHRIHYDRDYAKAVA